MPREADIIRFLMALTTGTRLGPYEVLSPLGAGGMGEVYRARDTRLDRVVAIKVLASHRTDSGEMQTRLAREARAVSSLNHPHICTLYDIGREGEADYLVMECLEGETLASRLERGPLPIADLLRCAIQIGDALDKAHRHGLVHRDLKPGNVMLTKSGAKLLDFGLARNTRSPMEPGAMTASPTMTRALTAEGTIVGTFQYMAPEQLEGSEADARSDIFAFGLILYEMATGRRAFDGKTQASVIAAILKDEPRPMSEVQALTPVALERLVRTCLRKEPDERRQTMHDVVLDLQGIAEDGSRAGGEAGTDRAPVSRRAERLWIGLALVFFLTAAALALLHFRGSAPALRVVSASIVPPDGTTFEFVGLQAGPPALSPDGRHLAFTARSADGRTSLWVQSLDRPEARKLPGTDGATSPFWSPDSGTIAFFADKKLKKIAIGGGPAIDLCEANDGRGGSWNAEGVIVFAPHRNSGIHRIAASGGVSTPLTSLDPSRENDTHRFPVFLPDGRRFLFLTRYFKGTEQSTMLAVGTVNGDPIRELFPANSTVSYAMGHLLFMRETTLMAQAMDASSLELQGEPFQIADKIQVDTGFGRGTFSASQEGTLIYQTGTAQMGSQLVWYDRAGKAGDMVGEQSGYLDVEISPDGGFVAVSSLNPQVGPPDIWIHDLSRGVRSRFTFEPRAERFPVWSHDGSRLAFRQTRSTTFRLIVKDVAGAGGERVLFESSGESAPMSWSRDGRLLLFQMRSAGTRNDIWVMPLSGDLKPAPLLQTGFNEESARLSPDGRWVVYASDESGRYEIYATPFPGPGHRWQVSATGGTLPRWSPDGAEIFFISEVRQLMVASVQARDGRLEIGQARMLFGNVFGGTGVLYDVSPDGRRFLVNTPSRPDDQAPLTLRLNWPASLRR
jgi:Tol biopolymer transport system component